MTIFSCTDIEVSFGELTLFENLNLNIFAKDKVGIVGVNGAGKTTLFKLFLGQLTPNKGNIFRANKLEIGYLSQYSGLDSNKTVIDEFMLPYTFLTEIEEKIASIEKELLLEHSDKMMLSGQLAKLHEAYNENGGNEYRNRIRSILLGLGFPEDMWTNGINTLSGGQKTRLALGRLLLQAPNVLMLDEPTNHLDVESVEWLENHLKSYQGTLIVISHDRYFLNTVTTKTLLIENGEAYMYNSPYNQFLVLREADIAYQEKCYKQQQKEIAKIQAFVEKQRQWNRERNIIAAESRLKKLERMTIIEKYKEDEKISPIILKIDDPCGKEVLMAYDLAFGYTDTPLFKDLSFQIFRGDRVFIKGPNGCGKTTLLKILTGNLKGYSGSFKIGTGIKPVYYSQDLSDLNLENTIFDEIFDEEQDENPANIRKALAAFGFKGDDVFKKISKLSGGEKARVSLLKITYSGSPFLILDEPTNHLDINTREILENALLEYEGTILAVSHDRYFVNKLATKFIDMTPATVEEDQKRDTTKRDSYLEQKEERARKRKTEILKAKLETEIQKAETRIKELELLIYSNTNYEEVQQMYLELETLKVHLSEITDQYLELIE